MLYYHLRHYLAVFIIIFANIPMTSHAETLDSNQQPRSIRVSGKGSVSVAPDKADLTLSIEINAKTAEAARNQAATAMDVLIKALKDNGVAAKDIQTSLVSLYPNYSNDSANRIIGYQLTNQVAVCIRDINKTSDIIDSAVKAGGNSTRVQGITFGIENPEPAQSQARAKAFANAKMKAEEYAKLAGVSLAAPLHISEGSYTPPTPMPYGDVRMKAAMAESTSTPVQAGEQEVTITVDVIFGIK